MGEVFIYESSDRGSIPLISKESFLDVKVGEAFLLNFQHFKNSLALYKNFARLFLKEGM